MNRKTVWLFTNNGLIYSSGWFQTGNTLASMLGAYQKPIYHSFKWRSCFDCMTEEERKLIETNLFRHRN